MRILNRLLVIVVLIVYGFFTSGCSVWHDQFGSSKNLTPGHLLFYQKYEERDYAEHLKSIGQQYLIAPSVIAIDPSNKALQYLTKIYSTIVNNNELLLNKSISPRFFIVNDPSPFYFSLPGGQFFFSVALINKYFEHEQWLVAALAHEIIRSHLHIYVKRRIVPVGYVSTARILSLTRLPLETKIEVNKWTYLAMQRAGYDSSALLTWLQTQNKNALDFTLQLGNSRNISREEFMFKNFVAQKGISERDGRAEEINSSKDFYNFISEIKKIEIKGNTTSVSEGKGGQPLASRYF
ncbi:MAG: hypothetical protein A2504_06190 [Bdellovibrionales bacterium RIFOXYD12_FULL_39_22]|nr:MAG: hypothetical protein A2385_08510 [Bdellovibrionales bacterium RIFOXYB1_FULL_39_21]OFZ45255.1 MAG: hypothetical protein A2485_06025 [Bdellovibrionales bacterium RIFOXYC12_FULL_39_17]OFZ45555.1 MAG: hypothetical protein A2404_03090 [Bdellovibrionales bacterium RIFOXYC1_FULL_39_130]OFZ74511.1 MAG: hypothetical protein A2451_08810 [Bdellovibrionales bacterium RIFOXYC2_FULL_39_8]OFZ77416.1 MAG: hypothetical protein A2560_08680 [Bdellovibrionales bacterium RIFOXYD1_FULL_39_84]OFZ91545.1 MAG: